MIEKDLYKLTRLYLNAVFEKNTVIALDQAQTHYLKNVLRMGVSDRLRVFNGENGEWLAEISSLEKRGGQLVLQEQLREQDISMRRVQLLFAPIKKQRMDFLIEKSVELGVTDLHPVLTHRTEARGWKADRAQAQIIEATEQCERLTIPVLHTPVTLERKVQGWRNGLILACVERCDAQPLRDFLMDGDVAFLIGPEGGFDLDERLMLEDSAVVRSVNLGENILRAETAAIACLSFGLLAC